MFKHKLYNLLAILGLLFLVTACSEDDLVFDHEKPQFQTKDGAYLLEVIMPLGTNVDDDIYIVGAFNGGDVDEIVGDLRWKLEKCEANNIKWGIYLYPSDFVSGTSLENGYTFYNEQQGFERTLQDTEVTHTEAPALGGRINVTVDRWAAFFEKPINPDEVEHDGYAIYVDNQTSWEALALYAWASDMPELFGGWPGITPTGVINIGGTKYSYFDTGKANEGLQYNIIFNNNNNGKQIDGPAVVLDRDYYFVITDDGWEETEAAPAVTHDGFAIFVYGETGWDDIAMYAWGNDLPELYGGWPGIQPTGEQTINGIVYKYFDTGASNEGLTYNFILNNNGGGKQFDLCSATLDRNYYFFIDDKHGVEIDPSNPNVGPVEPDPDPVKTPHTFYINNKLAWEENALYAYGDVEMFGAWPGKISDGTVNIDGAEYQIFHYEGAGENLTLILNNNNQGQQVDGPGVVADRDYYFTVDENGWTEVNPQLSSEYRIYVDNQTGWESIALYAWGENGLPELFGGWPGATPAGTETIGGVTYSYFTCNGAGETYNLILNNNGGGNQIDGPAITVDRDYYFKVDAEGWTEVEAGSPADYKIYVDNQTGWESIALYAWGENGLPELFGGWPGATPVGTETVDGVVYSYFNYSGAGETYNLILNNNGGGSQVDGPAITLDGNYYFKVETTGWTEVK